MTALLEVEDLTVSYGNIVAVDRVSVVVEEAKLLALLGPNGAGKSSLINAVCGLVPAAHGVVRYDGAAITGRRAHRLARAGIRLVPEGRALFPEMSVRENLLIGGHGRRAAEVQREVERATELFPVLGKRSSQQAGTLSGGEQQMLSIARALVASPRLLVLDEPSMGLAPKIVTQIIAALGRLRDDGLTVLLSEQNAANVFAVADQALILSSGKVVAAGAPSDVRERLEDAYLGGGAPPLGPDGP